MYRQVNINPNWRSDQDLPFQTYELTTVTYGTAATLFLATQSLQQLAKDEVNEFPLASEISLNDFYIDDLLTGSDIDIEKAKTLQSELILLLAKGVFLLRKWCSNSPELLKHIPDQDKEEIKYDQFSQNQSIETFGLMWQPKEHNFLFCVQELCVDYMITKRSVLPNIAKLYDHLGLLSPVIVTAKLLIQSLWKAKIDWDEQLPPTEKAIWLTFRENLLSINDIRLKRHIIPNKSHSIELHGFADASMQAYGACVYLRSIDELGNSSTMLLCGKSRVAPLKTISIARLELFAALLLSNLIDNYQGC